FRRMMPRLSIRYIVGKAELSKRRQVTRSASTATGYGIPRLRTYCSTFAGLRSTSVSGVSTAITTRPQFPYSRCHSLIWDSTFRQLGQLAVQNSMNATVPRRCSGGIGVVLIQALAVISGAGRAVGSPTDHLVLHAATSASRIATVERRRVVVISGPSLSAITFDVKRSHPLQGW